MIRNMLFYKLAAIFGFVFLFATANGNQAEAKIYPKCKTAYGPMTCSTSKRKAYYYARKKCLKYFKYKYKSKFWKIKKRSIKCKRKLRNGKVIHCCRCVVRICKRLTYKIPKLYPKPKFPKDPGLKKPLGKLGKLKVSPQPIPPALQR